MTGKQEVDMFGCSVNQLRHAFEDPLLEIEPSMIVISILSDVQELISSVSEGDTSGHTGERLELARQFINRAKFGVSEYLIRLK